MLSGRVSVEVDVDPQVLMRELVDLESFYGKDNVEKYDDKYLLKLTLKGVGTQYTYRIPVYVQVVGNKVYHVGMGEYDYLASFELIGTSKGTLLIAYAQLKSGRRAWFMGARLDLLFKELVDAAIGRALIKRGSTGYSSFEYQETRTANAEVERRY